jgi:catechol 2,3-dioxygenase
MNDFHLPPQTHIGYANLYTANLARALDFYGDKMGFQQIGSDDDTVMLSADGHTPHILLTERKGWKAKPARSTGLYHVAILLPGRAALARLFKRLVSLRYPFGGFSDHAVSEALYLNDPDGNGLELYRDRPREQWKYIGNQVYITTEALDVEKLLKEGDDSNWTGIDPAAIIGHVHVHVADLEQARAFYMDVLGLELAADLSNQGVMFVAAGGYHHHIGFNIWAGQQRQPPQTLGLRLFTLNVPDAETLDQLRERLYSAAVTVEAQPDHSLLVHDPVGNAIKLVKDN